MKIRGYIPSQKKEKETNRNESLYRHQLESHSFSVDKFSSTRFISCKNDTDTVTCGGPEVAGRFQPPLGSGYPRWCIVAVAAERRWI